MAETENKKPKTVSEMMGEMVRELAVLVVVFVPLEVLGAFRFALGWIVTTLIVESTVVSCVVLAIVGIWIERRRGEGE